MSHPDIFDEFQPKHFRWETSGPVATVTLNRPEKKNPLTFDSYEELRQTFHRLADSGRIKAVVITGAGENFCSGGDVHEIIAPLLEMEMTQLLNFTRMTCDLIFAIRSCPQVVIAAVDGVCAGAGAAIAMACDVRLGTARSRTAFLFSRIGLAGCDMGACSLLPRIVGQGRAAELLLTGRAMDGTESERSGFFSRLCEPTELGREAAEFAARIAAGPTLAHATTKRMLNREWNMSIEEALEAEAHAQAECMMSNDFRRGYDAFCARSEPKFEGN